MRRVIGAGLLGAVVLMAWTLVVNGVLGFQARIDMKQIPAERQVYDVLKEHITEPGRYVCNPEPTPEGRFPDGEPVFSVLYGGGGHESAGGLMLVGLVVFILTPMIGAWMLSQTSSRVKSSFVRKLSFFVAIGVLFALFGDLMRFGIGSYPLKDVLAFAINHIVAWTLVGLVVSWRIRPQSADAGA